jgi:uncharacterized protein YjbI with pentapeptide repeats
MKKYLPADVFVYVCMLLLTVVGRVDSACASESLAARENLEKLITTRSCKGCDLSGLTLNRMNLTGVDLEGADLSLTKLSLTNLTGANLRNTNLRGTVFGGTDLSNADLRGADLRGTSLDSAYHEGALLDGEFVTSKPYENLGETEIEKEVYVADPGKPKKNPETREVKVGTRRDLEDPPPTLAAVPATKEVAVPAGPKTTHQERTAPSAAPLASAPAAKKVAPVQQPIIDVPIADPPVVTVAAASQRSSEAESEKNPAATPDTESPSKKAGSIMRATTADKPPADAVSEVAKGDKKTPQATIVKETKELKERKDTKDTKEPKDTKKIAEGKPVEEGGGAGEQSQDLAAEKVKKDNLTRLFAKNKCFGCDLSGLDLAGKDLEGVDLEKADLTGCNLEKADLDKANLKGALLLKANLRGASLQGADLYKADLTGADLTGAKVTKAMFDNAKTASAVGLAESPESGGK